MTATKIQPGDDTHLTLLMAPHSLNFVTGTDRAALLAYGRDVFAAARDSKCLAQIEEPAQPVAEICSASHDDAQFGERAIKPLCDISGFDYGTPLYAGAAPAAVGGASPKGWRLVPATPTREWIAALVDDGYEDCNCAQMIASILSHAPAAPALEAPAAPAPADEFRGDTPSLVRNILALLELDAEGALVPHGVGGHARGLLSAAAARLAAAPQAPAKGLPYEPTSDMLNAGRACDPALPLDTVRAIWWAMWRTAPQAPAAPSAYSADLLAALGQWHQRCEVMGAHHTLTEAQIAELVVAGLLRRAHGGQVITTAGRAALAAPAAPAVDASDTALLDFLQQTATAVEVLAQDEGEPPRFLVNRAISKDVRSAIRLARGKALAAQAKEGGATA